MKQKKVKYRPLHDRILVMPDKVEDVSKGGIIIPDTAKERPRTGRVIASGPGLKDLPNETKPGDKIFYAQYAGTEVTLEDVDYIMMRESDVLLIETPE